LDKVLIIIYSLIILSSCKFNGEKANYCHNPTVVSNNNAKVSFCLPNYLKNLWIDSVFTGYEPNMKIQYNYSLNSNPNSYSSEYYTPILHEDSLYVNTSVSIVKDDGSFKLLPKGNKYLTLLIKKTKGMPQVRMLNTFYKETNKFYVYEVEYSPSKSSYINEKIFFTKNDKYSFTIEFKVLNSKDGRLKYQEDAKKLMQSIQIESIK